jgi:hypothetical protein
MHGPSRYCSPTEGVNSCAFYKSVDVLLFESERVFPEDLILRHVVLRLLSLENFMVTCNGSRLRVPRTAVSKTTEMRGEGPS